MVCEIWQGMDACLYHAAHINVYAQTFAAQIAGSTKAAQLQTFQQEDKNRLQEDLVVFRANLAGFLWQMSHLIELIKTAYKRCKEASIIDAAQQDQLVFECENDSVLNEIIKYRNLSHQFAGVIITIHDGVTHEFVAHVLPALDGSDMRYEKQERPLDVNEIKNRELATRVQVYCNHLGGYCERLFRLLEAVFGADVFPRSRGVLVPIPHSYLGDIPEGATNLLYWQIKGEIGENKHDDGKGGLDAA